MDRRSFLRLAAYAAPAATVPVWVPSAKKIFLPRTVNIRFENQDSGVWVDTRGNNTGTGFPIGTERCPVNNFSDALSIAHERDIYTFYVLGEGEYPVRLSSTGPKLMNIFPWELLEWP